MSLDPAPRRPARGLLLVLLACCLPGCVTKALWAGYGEGVGPVATYELVGEHRDAWSGSLQLHGPALGGGLWFCDDAGDALFRLAPDRDAYVAAVLLENPDACDVQLAVLSGERNLVGAEVVLEQATVELRAWWREGVLGEAVEASQLPGDVVRVLAADYASRYAFAYTPNIRLPSLFRECVERAATTDLGWVADRPRTFRMASSVFVVAEGGEGKASDVRFDPRDLSQRHPTERELGELTLLEQLDVLARYDLVVRATSGRETCYVRLRPDWLWLSSGMNCDRGRVVHRSVWTMKAARDGAQLADPPSLRVPGRMNLLESRFVRTVVPGSDGGDLWFRVALTPVALAADLVFGVIAAILTDDEDDDGGGGRSSRHRRKPKGADDPFSPQNVRDRERRAKH